MKTVKWLFVLAIYCSLTYHPKLRQTIWARFSCIFILPALSAVTYEAACQWPSGCDADTAGSLFLFLGSLSLWFISKVARLLTAGSGLLAGMEAVKSFYRFGPQQLAYCCWVKWVTGPDQGRLEGTAGRDGFSGTTCGID